MIDYQPPKPVDWPDLILQIRNSHAYMTNARIAALLECAESTLTSLLYGHTKNPNWIIASRLIAMHEQFVLKEV